MVLSLFHTRQTWTSEFRGLAHGPSVHKVAEPGHESGLGCPHRVTPVSNTDQGRDCAAALVAEAAPAGARRGQTRNLWGYEGREAGRLHPPGSALWQYTKSFQHRIHQNRKGLGNGTVSCSPTYLRDEEQGEQPLSRQTFLSGRQHFALPHETSYPVMLTESVTGDRSVLGPELFSTVLAVSSEAG